MPRKKAPGISDKLGAVKKGFLSAEEKGHIAAKLNTQNAEQIAKKLNRDPKQIQKEIDKMLGIETTSRMSLTDQLVSRPEWRQFKKQFTPEELEEFKHQYVQIMSQMKDDVFATEELQVFQVITLKILIDRTLAEQKLALDDMNRAHIVLQEYGGQVLEDDELKNLVIQAAETYEISKKTNKDCADRYKLYSDKQDKMLSALKATRDQRVKVWENSKTSILGWLRTAMEPEAKREWGDEAEINKVASQKEKNRLAQPHKYPDGTIDQPLYTPETALIDFNSEAEGETEVDEFRHDQS